MKIIGNICNFAQYPLLNVMASKLWEKSVKVNHDVETYTIGLDREMDLYLAPYDVIGSLAHTTMLETIGLIAPDELKIIRKELISIYHDIQNGKFTIDEGIEDVHSQIEFLLTERIGDIGKKIHSGRRYISMNYQNE